VQLADQGGSRVQPAVKALARTAVTPGQRERLRELAGDDIDLRWRALTRLAALGELDRAELEDLTARDPDPDSWVRALGVEAARPETAGKDAAFEAAVVARRVPSGSLSELAASFWQPAQAPLLAPYVDRYAAVLDDLGNAGMLVALSTAGIMFPLVGPDRARLDRLVEQVSTPEMSPLVRRVVTERAEALRHMLTARGQ